MKKYIMLLLITLVTTVIAPSCLEEYLDQAPESGLSEQEVFTKYENFKNYFDAVYDGRKYFSGGWRDYNIRTAFPLYFGAWDQKWVWEGSTDCGDQGRYMEGQAFKQGQCSAFINKFTYDGKRRPLLESMFTAIRVCNTAIQNIDMITDAPTQEDLDDLLAQAHFVRAFCHFELMRFWGPMPYIDHVIGADDPWDIPRLGKAECLEHIALDLDTAAIFYAKADRMRRDAPPGEPGHLTSPDMFRPNGVAAKAYKARALLYAASPLNNSKGQSAWEDAAKAAWEAIKLAEEHGYALLSAADYKLNGVGVEYTNEQIWGYYFGTMSYNTGNMRGLVGGIFQNSKSSASGLMPTQNFVDKFETKWGDPLNTEADREAARAMGHYNEQDPYADRDPRFYIDIIYNGAPLVGFGKAEIYYERKDDGSTKYGNMLNQSYLGITKTGYMQRKKWGDQSTKNRTKPKYSDPLMRLAELYLNYAEAANEAYGPNSAAPGASITAVQAINVIRNRIGMDDVLSEFTGNKDIFRDRIKNERNIELFLEGHYYHDIRRWMDAPQTMAGPLMGVDIEKVGVSDEYPTGYKYTRLPLPADRQSTWKDAMYYLPFNTEDNFKMQNFVPNVVW